MGLWLTDQTCIFQQLQLLTWKCWTVWIMRRVVKLLSWAFYVLLITFGWEQTEQIAMSSFSGILYLKCLYVVFVLLWYTVLFFFCFCFYLHLTLLGKSCWIRSGPNLLWHSKTFLHKLMNSPYQWQWLGQWIGTGTVTFVCPIDQGHSTQFKHAWTLTRDEDYDGLINKSPALILVK